MRKFFLFALLIAATAMMAETRVENFNPKDGNKTAKVYETSPVTKECESGIKWTMFCGGLQQNLGAMGSTNWATVVRAKYANETYEGYPYIMSDSIEDGIDSLWFTWNSNGGETGYTWNVKVYVNDEEVGSIAEAGAAQYTAPFRTFQSNSKINVPGKFVIKIVNESSLSVSSNKLRLVVDDLSWNTYGSAPVKPKPTFEFAEEKVLKVIGSERFTNPLTNTSDATPVFESSDPYTARVDQTGEVTITKLGTATITATIAETETYKAATASYTIRIVPENFNMETFDGAANITSGTSYYITKDSVCPASSATGIVWTTYLGSVRNTMASWPAANIAACVRAKKSAEPKFGYLKSDVIKGGIDSLAFDWNTNGDESTRKQDWNIVIYINGDSVGAITDKPAAKQAAGNEFRYTLGNLKIDGDFTIEFVNKDTAEAGGNEFRWAIDNLEWYGYEAPCEGEYGIMVDGENYIGGVKNEEQTQWLEYKIDATLKASQTFVIYDKCMKAGFMAGQDNDEANYKFNYTEGGTAFVVPQDGKYTIYLKMYGPDNNWLWTSRSDVPTGIENAMLKADVRKAIENGVVVIYRNGVRYNLQGQNF